MHTNVKQIELADTSASPVPSRAMYHKTITEPLEKLPDIDYLLRQLDENEFLGYMKTKRIIRYSPWTDFTAVETYDFVEEISLPTTLGKPGRLIPPFAEAQFSHSRENIESIISPANIMKITHLLDPHDVVVVCVPDKHRLSDIVIDSTCSIDLLLGKDGKRYELLYWFTMGHSGIFKMTAKVIKDDESFLAKLKANLDDVPMREYLVQRSMADSKMALEYVERVRDRMTVEECAEYLRMPKSTLEDKVAKGVIKSYKSGRRNIIMREDADAYLRRRGNK